MLMKVIVMLCFMKFTMCEETTETITSESLSNTTDNSYGVNDLTTSYNETQQSTNSTDMTSDDDGDNDDDEDSDVDFMTLLKKSLAVILVYLGDLLLITIDKNPSTNETMIK
uniref:SJCHGC06541 protein n=1 Tax=Schistosoma japonicum TaxID=6182 RepID=Q5D8T2_SCHJA|nr:SJCHGC06541 protein [Schistosoma japonicum]